MKTPLCCVAVSWEYSCIPVLCVRAQLSVKLPCNPKEVEQQTRLTEQLHAMLHFQAGLTMLQLDIIVHTNKQHAAGLHDREGSMHIQNRQVHCQSLVRQLHTRQIHVLAQTAATLHPPPS
jgi:hypothetical protein